MIGSGGGQTLEVRPFGLDDVDPLVAALRENLPTLRRFMPWAHAPVTREGHFEILSRFIADYWTGKDQAMGIFSANGEILGGVGLHARTPLNPKALEVGYWGHAAHTGRGNVTRAVQMVVALTFDAYGADRLQVGHDSANTASQRVIERVGFAFEGTLRNALATAPPALAAVGFEVSGTTRLYALCPEDLARLSWLEPLRDGLEVVDALGARRPWRSAFAV